MSVSRTVLDRAVATMQGLTYAEVLEQVLGLAVDVQLAVLRVLGEVQSGDLGDVLVLALTLLLLKLEGDATDGATLNTLHQVGGVASNLCKENPSQQIRRIILSTVASRRSPGSKDSARRVLTLLRRRLEAMMAISSQMRLLVSKSRVRRG